jgi:hypothetical protein
MTFDSPNPVFLITLASKHLTDFLLLVCFFICHRFTKRCVFRIFLNSTVGRETRTARTANIQSFACRKLQSICQNKFLRAASPQICNSKNRHKIHGIRTCQITVIYLEYYDKVLWYAAKLLLSHDIMSHTSLFLFPNETNCTKRV